MRILYILTSLGIGGAEKQVIDLAEGMKARGHIVALMVLTHTEQEWPVKLPVFRLNLKKTPLGALRGLRFAQGFLKVFRPDLLHSHTFPANIFARMLRMLRGEKTLRPRLINTIHNVHEGGWQRMLAYRLTDSLSNHVTAVSGAAAERFMKLHAVSAKKMSVLTNGIDTEDFAPDRNRRKRMRFQMQTGKAFVWLAVGRLVAAKDYPNLLHAFEQVRMTHPTTVLWIAGEGDCAGLLGSSEGELAASGIHMLGLRSDIVDLLDAADAYVLSSAWEGMPLALGEAMAMEKLVVATDVGGVRELVGAAGSVVPANNCDALAQVMLSVMGFTEWQRNAQGKEARRRIEAQFSMRAKAEEWEQLYATLLSDRPA